ncbi:MAG: hypothetical protein C0501_10770 [Isosphaera sp.]|nr:hypothetical protein [Isosphaera sp.]
MGEKVTIPADLRAKLAGANGAAVPLYDDAGNLIGFYLSPERMAGWEDERKAAYEAAALVTEEQLDAAERRGGRHSMDEVFKLLKGA